MLNNYKSSHEYLSLETNLERLLVGLRSLMRWPPGGRRAVVSPSTIHELLKKIYEHVGAIDDQCPMHCDDSATIYAQECKVQFERLGVTASFALQK